MPLPKGRDLDLTRKQLTEWLAERLSAANDLELGPLAGPEATGFSNDTLLFDATWTQDGRKHAESLVARIKPTGYLVFPEYDLALQYDVMKTLGEEGSVPVPRVRWFEEREEILGAPFYVMERVAGRIPTDNPPYHVGGWLTEVEPAEREAIWWSGLESLAQIHRLDWRALGFARLGAPEDGRSALARQLAYYREYLRWAARGIAQPTVEAGLEWLESKRPAGVERVALCWGDARIGNMIFREGRCQAVLDWEMVTLGNPVQDLAWWLFVDRHHSEGVGAPRLEGFPSREETIARYTELTGAAVENLEYYEIFAGMRFGVIMIRLAQQLEKYGLLPEGSDFETNNIVTRLLARLLEIPQPGS